MIDLSYQLYSARNHPPLADHLRLLASLGYKHVEGYGGLYADPDPAALRRLLDEAGLTMPTAHIGLDVLRDTGATVGIAEALGVETVFCPHLAPDERDEAEDGWKALADELSALAETYDKAGIGLGYHNHDFEFRPTTAGTMPMELLLKGAPALVWEADIAWIQKGGQDPAVWIDKYADRLSAAHLKDIAAPGEALDEDGWADFGHGVMPWEVLMRQLTTSTACRYFVVEHDKPSDAARFAERSIRALREMGY